MPTPQSALPATERTIQVVTPDNAEAFYAERLGETPQTPETQPEEKPNTEAKAETKEVDEPAAEELERDHKDGKLSARFKELTDKRKAAENLAAQREAALRLEREARELAERQAAELKAKYEPPKSDELGPKPTLSQFSTPEEFEKALEDWTTDKVTIEAKTRAAEDAAMQHKAQVAKEWQERMASTVKEIPDYQAKIDASPVKVSDELRDAILESEVGPKIIYHFAEHPEVAERLAKLTVGSALRELGKIEAGLMTVKEPPVKAEEKPQAEISKAPAPISPLKGANAPAGVKIDADGNFYGTYEEYKAARKAGRIK